ncbi:MAG: hypothetical protein JW943_15075 [Deltaproteobacteria bacterium]|nr:hypothetical protein [Deltaproteobacteria bacterium]
MSQEAQIYFGDSLRRESEPIVMSRKKKWPMMHPKNTGKGSWKIDDDQASENKSDLNLKTQRG